MIVGLSVIVSAFFVVSYFMSNNGNTYHKGLNIIKSEKRKNGTYIKTRDSVSKTGKEIFIDNDNNIYTNEYIE